MVDIMQNIVILFLYIFNCFLLRRINLVTEYSIAIGEFLNELVEILNKNGEEDG